MSLLGITVSAVTSAALVVLFVASVRYQFRSAEELRLRRPPPLKLLRHYRLFAPRPTRTDMHLVVRDFGPDGAPRRCKQIPVIHLRRWTDALWSPNKRRWLALMPMMVEMSAISTILGDDRPAVQLSTPYLALLGVVAAEPGIGVSARQFLFVERFGREPEHDTAVVFCSAVHRLDRPGRDDGPPRTA